MAKAIPQAVMIDVMIPEVKRFGIVHPATPTKYKAEIVPGASLSIFMEGKLVNVFAIGDSAEYDSYNLSYTGIITGITPKRVTITKYPGTPNAKKYCLNLYTFCWRNYDFDAAETAQKNAETMQCI